MGKKTKIEIIMRDSRKYIPSSTFCRNHSFENTSIFILLILVTVMIPKIIYDPVYQWIVLNLFRLQIGVPRRVIRVRCYTECIHYASDIFGVVSMSMIDDRSFWGLKTCFGFHIPKLTRRYRNRLFLFLLLMEHNTVDRLRDEIMVLTLFWPLRCDGNCLKVIEDH